MIDIVLSVCISSLLFVIFKLFDRFNINSFQAIVCNYIVACLCGVIAYPKSISTVQLVSFDWFWYTFILGIIFISVFNFMSITTQRNGLSVVAVASKMSLIIPVIFGTIAYQEQLGALKVLGILLALIAVYLVTAKPQKSDTANNLLFPALVFFGSGIIDTSLKFLQTTFVAEADFPIFSATLFGAAGFVGVIAFIYLTVRKQLNFQYKNLIAGIILGVVNYFSVVYLIKALSYPKLDSSTLFTINNVSILLLSTFIGLIFFKEYLSKKNIIGIIVAVAGIVLVSLASST